MKKKGAAQIETTAITNTGEKKRTSERKRERKRDRERGGGNERTVRSD
jgi:hypothetical protein